MMEAAGSCETLLTIYIKLYGVIARNIFTAVRTSSLTHQGLQGGGGFLSLPKLEERGC
jgi:hypothetical protein